MSILSRLFGGGGAPTPRPEPEAYKGFAITADPMKEGPRWRIAAHIVKEIGGETKTHHLIRADTLDDHETAVKASLGKARQMIDEQGDRIFD